MSFSRLRSQRRPSEGPSPTPSSPTPPPVGTTRIFPAPPMSGGDRRPRVPASGSPLRSPCSPPPYPQVPHKEAFHAASATLRAAFHPAALPLPTRRTSRFRVGDRGSRLGAGRPRMRAGCSRSAPWQRHRWSPPPAFPRFSSAVHQPPQNAPLLLHK